MQEDLLKVLESARARIDRPEQWCKEWAALDAEDQPVRPTAGSACKWCAEGAVRWAMITHFSDLEYSETISLKLAAFDAVAEAATQEGELTYLVPSEFNDREDTTHADVLAAFDKAIADVKSHL
jgi:hypothetical protein